jgi:predicted RND superfamily exporter protein
VLLKNGLWKSFTKLDNSVQDSAQGSALVGRAIGGLGALMYLGYMGWQMAAGDREWEITPMLKPILIGFTLVYWTGFVNLIQAPFEAIAEPGIAIFSDIESEVNDLRVQRFKKQQQLLDAVIKLNAEEDAKQEVINNTRKDADDSWFDISEGLDKLIQPIKEWQIRMEFQMQKLVAEVIEFVCLSILRICVYLIFFIQKIWAYILIILGPIAVGMALFQDLKILCTAGFPNSSISISTLLLLIPLSISDSNSSLLVIPWK